MSDFTRYGGRSTGGAAEGPRAAAIRADCWMEDDRKHMDVASSDLMSWIGMPIGEPGF